MGGRHTEDNWLIHGTKHHKDTQLLNRNTHEEYSKYDKNEAHGKSEIEMNRPGHLSSVYLFLTGFGWILVYEFIKLLFIQFLL